MGDIEARFRPRLQHAAVLQEPIGMQHRRNARPALRRDAADRGRAHARTQHAAIEKPHDELGQLLVAEGLPSCAGVRSWAVGSESA